MKAQESFKSVCDDIYAITGIKPVIYDAGMQLVYAHPLSMGEFCQQIRCLPSMTERCLQCDRVGFEQCRKSGEINIYHCHMGLTEAVTPVVDHGTVIGYILFGQLLEKSARDEVAKTIREMQLPNEPLLLELLSCMTSADEEIIRASARLMSMCAHSIELQRMIKMQHGELAVSIADYIGENLREEITIGLLCRRFGISRGTLYTISRNAFGMGITEYIQSRRLDAAVELLRKNELPVYRVAEAVGIGDANYFTKLIKKRTGMTPKQLKIQEKA